MLIDGFSISGYRSFGPTIQRLGPCQKINILAGPNNSGKSNLLSLLQHQFGELCHRGNDQRTVAELFTDLDRHRGAASERFSFGLAVRIDDKRFQELGDKMQFDDDRTDFESLLSASCLSHGTECIWIDRSADARGERLQDSIEIVEVLEKELDLSSSFWTRLYNQLRPNRGGGRVQGWIREIVLDEISPFNFDPPKVSFVPTIRSITSSGGSAEDLSGAGIIVQLARLQNPELPQRDDRRIFDDITTFLRTVIGNETATLEIPYERNSILVHMDGKTLPLTSLGTGIHEVVILAAAATIVRNQVLCIEEPELHLHPILQRKLIEYLYHETDNQYFIATHSAHILDTADAAVFHVSLVDGESRIRKATCPADRFEICRDLGFRASALMQTNCIIWVEGPSDRIYLNHWIAHLDDALVEGTHYSVMFYGGRLLNHLTVDDPEIDDFISLRRLNRNTILIMDSDREKPHSRLNRTKIRIRREFDANDGFAWVTAGREIENYIAPDILREAVDTVSPGRGARVKTGRFDHVLPFRNDRRKTRVDKLKVAQAVVNASPDLSVLDLQKRIQDLVKFIRDCQ